MPYFLQSLKGMRMRIKYLFIFFLLFAIGHTVFADPFSRLTPQDHPLKRYAPDQLKMVGSITQQDNVLGIVRAPDNHVYTVKPGSQLGNSAYVVDVTSKKITVQQQTQMIELTLRNIK